MQRVVLFLLLQYLIFCNYYEILNAKAIIGNNIRQVREKEFTFIVSISFKRSQYDPLTDHICTGTLITREHVLCAEHCMFNNLTEIQVLIGSINLYKCESYNLKAWVSYAEWIKSKNYHLEYSVNDISIISLEKRVNDPEIKLATLTTKAHKELYGLDVTIAGWGKTNSKRISILMEMTMLKVLTKKKCFEKVTKLTTKPFTIPNSVICTAADPYALLGNGESGGPLLDTNNVLLGVNEGTAPPIDLEFHSEEVNIHSSISYYRNFIDDIIKNS